MVTPSDKTPNRKDVKVMKTPVLIGSSRMLNHERHPKFFSPLLCLQYKIVIAIASSILSPDHNSSCCSTTLFCQPPPHDHFHFDTHLSGGEFSFRAVRASVPALLVSESHNNNHNSHGLAWPGHFSQSGGAACKV